MLELPPDITFYITIVLFLVFAGALERLIWKPTQALLAERGRRTTGAQDEAANLRREAEELARDLEEKLEQARRAASLEGDKVRREAEDLEAKLLSEARTEAAAILDDVRRRVATEIEEARTRLHEQAAPIARQAAEKILGRPVSA